MATKGTKFVNEARRHHYAPQFYLRQFACDDSLSRVRVLTQQHEFIVGEAKAISRMGYEDDLHSIETLFGRTSIEAKIAREIETPIAQSPTWSRVVARNYGALGESDVAILYLLCRHLERRNLATLKFIESEQIRVRLPEYQLDYSDEERRMHDAIAAAPKGAHAFFLEGVLQTTPILEELDEVGITICQSVDPLRSSTNPSLTVRVPAPEADRRCASGQPARAWWLPLSRSCGALITLGTSRRGLFHEPQGSGFVRYMNRLYLVQLLSSPAVRYCLADDSFIDADLSWADYQRVSQKGQKLRYRKISS